MESAERQSQSETLSSALRLIRTHRRLRAADVGTTVDGGTTVTGPDGVDTLRNIERLLFDDGAFDLLTGAAVTNVVHGTMAADSLGGTTAADIFHGGAGDDVITGGLGNDTIDGGAGFDTVIVSGSRADYRLLQTADDGFILKGPDGGDRLTGVEMIRFGDGSTIDLLRQYGPDGWGALVDGSGSFEGPQVLPGVVSVKPYDTAEVLPGDDENGPWAKDHDEPLVLPGADDTALPVAKGVDQPEVLPGLEETPLFAGLEARLAPQGGWMPRLDDDGLSGGPMKPHHDDWM